MSSSQRSPWAILKDAKGRKNIKAVTRQGLVAWLLTVSASVIIGIQAIVDVFLITPAEVLTRITEQAAMALVIEPLSIAITGSRTSARAIEGMSLFGLPLAVVIVLMAFGIIVLYLRRPATSDLIPGTFTDFIGGTEEDPDPD